MCFALESRGVQSGTVALLQWSHRLKSINWMTASFNLFHNLKCNYCDGYVPKNTQKSTDSAICVSRV